MAGCFWLVTSIGFVGFILGLILNHFLPLFSNLGPLPKGSFGWPLLGETLSFLKPHPSNSVGAYLHDHCSRYGKVFKTHLFFSPTVVSLGDTHRRLRNVALSLVATIKSKPEFLGDIERIAVEILDSWKGRQQVMFCAEARKFTFNVIVKQVLGLTPEEPQTTKILEDFLTFMKGLISLPLNVPGTPYARAVKARRRISSTVKAIIEERRRSRRSSDGGGKYPNKRSTRSGTNGHDFLEILLGVESLSEDEKVSFVLDSLLGGYETTSVLMAMLVHFVGQSPAALAQLKLEHQTIRSMKGEDELLNWEDYKKMDFTQNVITEALRYGNVVKFVHRKALKDIKFRDYLIPCGWKVLPVLSAVHLDPSLHSDALQFHPWRWE
ncbi:hypothetical protein C3L33_10093, partial [Rhododendron williamsianum]